MKLASQHTMRRTLVIGAGLVVLYVTAVATVLAEEQKVGDVGTRAIPGAPPQQGQLPTFPQKFDVQGPESRSFGFAVTQPGPVVIDVQATGAPVIVTLQGLSSPPAQQQGSGQIRLSYLVTLQDVQKSVLWVVKVKLTQPAPPQQGGHASGTVMVQHPPVDQAVVQAQTTAMAAQVKSSRPSGQQALARMDAAFLDFKTKFEQQRQQRQASERAQNQPIIDQLRANAGGTVHSRGIEGDAPGGEGGEISSRALSPIRGTSSSSATVPLQVVPQPGSLALSPPPPAPTPVIDHLNKNQGQPKDQIIIYGKNFGNVGGDVVFQVGSNAGLTGVVEAWSDTVVVVDVPDVSGFLQFDGGVFIPMGQIQSNTAPFRFIPAQEVRMTHTAKGDVSVAQPGSISTATPTNGWDHIDHLNTTFWRLGGSAGNDIMFPTTRLKNGWIVQSITVDASGCGTPFCQGVYVADSRIGTDTLFFNARWWYDALADSDYDFAVWIIGPRGVPDGLVVP